MASEFQFVSPSLPPWKLSPLKRRPKSGLDILGTPGLDKLRFGRDRLERAEALGLRHNNVSFEANQSFPRMRLRKLHNSAQKYGAFLTRNEQSFSYNNSDSFIASNGSLIDYRSYEASFTKSVPNPYKVIICVNHDNQILVCNNMACQILGFSSSELVMLRLDDLISDLDKGKGIDALAEILTEGPPIAKERVLVSGKVVEVKTKDGELMAMSLWLKEVDPGRKLAILEPVERSLGKVRICTKSLQILSMDSGSEAIFQTSLEQSWGKSVHSLMPHINLPELEELLDEETLKQKTVGVGKDGVHFPIATILKLADEKAYELTVWVFSNISGLLVLSNEGLIEGANNHFVNLLFGYSTEMDVKGKSITTLIPGFFDDIAYFNSDDSDEENSIIEDLNSKRKLNFSSNEEIEEKGIFMSLLNNSSCDEPIKSPRPAEAFCDSVTHELKHLTSTPSGGKVKATLHLRSTAKVDFPEGSFFGLGKHKDGAEIDILYQIRRVVLEDQSHMYCLWIARDPEELGTRFGTLTLGSSHSATVDQSLGQSIRKAVEKRREMRQCQLNSSEDSNNKAANSSNSDLELYKGSYSEKYCTLNSIGTGAFGCVKSAFRRSDNLMVVTKFIKRSKVYEENWVTDTVLGKRLPLEISLLSTLDHPNIVKVLDVHENDEYLHLVMEKHGSGMDLFEFIDRRPKMDEALASYIFRQVVSAVDYLHNERGLLHRDIKDENIIIDEKFHVKLIDFGSVAPIPKDGWLYSTFYGTVEYCSPEVLNGNCYAGPELEMWTMGILLYVLIFYENPFYGVEETLQCSMQPPFSVSPPCFQLIKKLLTKDAQSRMKLDELAEHEWVTQPVQLEAYKFQDVVTCSDEELNPAQYHSDAAFSSPKMTSNDNLLNLSLAKSNESDLPSFLSDSLLQILE